jgi:hypothetical protein
MTTEYRKHQLTYLNSNTRCSIFLYFLSSDSFKSHPVARYRSDAAGSKRQKPQQIIFFRRH